MTQTETRREPPFAYVAYSFSLVGAAMLLVTPLIPIAHIDLLGESVEVRGLDGGGWGIALCGVFAAAAVGVALARHNPLWATAAALPGLVAIGWSAWYVFAKLSDVARLADRAELGWGGITWVTAGPILLIGSVAALIAARQPASSPVSHADQGETYAG